MRSDVFGKKPKTESKKQTLPATTLIYLCISLPICKSICVWQNARLSERSACKVLEQPKQKVKDTPLGHLSKQWTQAISEINKKFNQKQSVKNTLELFQKEIIQQQKIWKRKFQKSSFAVAFHLDYPNTTHQPAADRSCSASSVDYSIRTIANSSAMVVLEGGGGVVTIGNNQYLQPDYLAPLPTTVSIIC